MRRLLWMGTLATGTVGCAAKTTPVDKPLAATEPAARVAAPREIPTDLYGVVCGGTPMEFLDIVLPIAEDLQDQKVWYNSEDLSDCSGIFHRVLAELDEVCPGGELPQPDTHRTSRQLGAWYLDQGLLTIVDDPVVEDSLIEPGTVVFFGADGVDYVSLDPADAMESIRHVGTVVETERGEDGSLLSYRMFHGRRTGTYASITNWHKRDGSPPLGNGSDKIIGVTPISAPMAPMAVASNAPGSATVDAAPEGSEAADAVDTDAVADASEAADPADAAASDPPTPGQVGSVKTIMRREPARPALICNGIETDASQIVSPAAEGLVKETPAVRFGGERDQVRTILRLAEEVAKDCPELTVPPEIATVSYTRMAQWWVAEGRFEVVDRPADRSDWIAPGSILYYGPADVDYAGMDPEDLLGHVDHMAIVVSVLYGPQGEILAYTVYQAPEDTESAAALVRGDGVDAEVPLGLQGRAWLGVSILSTR